MLFVWYYLNTPKTAGHSSNSVRSQIIDKWKTFGQIDEDLSSELIDLYFGKGGRYSTDQLDNRASMYDQVESHINLMKQELMALAQEINTL